MKKNYELELAVFSFFNAACFFVTMFGRGKLWLLRLLLFSGFLALGLIFTWFKGTIIRVEQLNMENMFLLAGCFNVLCGVILLFTGGDPTHIGLPAFQYPGLMMLIVGFMIVVTNLRNRA